MIVTHKVNMDFISKDENAAVPQIRVVQGDCQTRMLELTLFADRMPWNVPEGTAVQMRYKKPDGTGGVYDTMPDGACAWGISGNTVSVQLAPQVLTVAGVVRSQIVLVLNEKFLATFEVRIVVEEDPSVGVLESEDYTNLQTWMTEKIHSILSMAMRSGEFDGATFVPAVSSAGELSWTNNRGLENPASVNINAPQGILPVSNGGTGANNANEARTNLGAAPAGFGLGETAMQYPPNNDLESIAASGLYLVDSTVVNGLPDVTNGHVRAEVRGNGSMTLFLYGQSDAKYQAIRKKVLGTWYDWEWVNPPMVTGTEYRTTERWQGQPVYTKLIDCGQLPASGRTVVPHNLATRILRYAGSLSDNGAVPFRDPTANGTVDLAISGNNIIITTAMVNTAFAATLTVQLWYIK